ncbi:hypothetical protein NDU88_001986 [Pleurodeles waltl]|uniref:Uncharacterized protein n=1 Tax=Pleurodeles waltl TaxID=8319 RepID=A0AAV7P875_PLEWA|nr:hypothetical protein NDU88_001986 [Pleurodeles waltl]
MAVRQGNQEPLEPETVAQGTAKKRKRRGRGKLAPGVSKVREEAEPEGDAPEPRGEQMAELGESPSCCSGSRKGGPPGKHSVQHRRHALLWRVCGSRLQIRWLAKSQDHT